MRNDIVVLGGTVTMDGHRFYPDQAGVKIKPIFTLVEVPDMIHARTEKVVVAKMVEIRFRPTKFSAAGLLKLYTHATAIATRSGSSIVGATDKVCIVRGNDGTKRTIACAYIHQEPALRCKGGQPILGEVVIRGIVGLTANAALTASYYAVSAEAWNDTGYDPAEEITPAFYVQFKEDEEDVTSWANMLVKDTDELTITPKSQLNEHGSQSRGLTNVTVKGYSVEISGSFLNISENQVLAAAYGDIQLGAKTTSLGRRLRIVATTGDAFIVVPNAVLRPECEFAFDLSTTVVSQLMWDSIPKFVESTWQSHLIVSDTDPDA